MSMNVADIYGQASRATGMDAKQGVGGPNPSAVASGTGMPNDGNGAAFSWLGFVLALVAWRIVYNMGGRVD